MKWVDEHIVLLGNQNGGYEDRESLRMDDPLLADFGGTLLALMNVLSPWIKGIVGRGYIGKSVTHFDRVRARAKVDQFFQAGQRKMR